ncbi:MAG TPA: hypothetical protein VF681_05030 [Abditibacteriaceae bacterium]|jgi:hypothetical protein
MAIRNWLLFAMLLASSAPRAVAAPGNEKRETKEAAQVKALAQAGRYEEARQRFPFYGGLLESDLVQKIRNAKKQKNNAQAVALYDTYFGLWPLGQGAYGSGEFYEESWFPLAQDYVKLLEVVPQQSARVAPEKAALRAYLAVKNAWKNEEKKPQTLAKVQRLTTQFPRSIFALAATKIYQSRFYMGEGEREIAQFCLQQAQVLEKANAPAVHQIIVLTDVTRWFDLEPQTSTASMAFAAYSRLEKLEKDAELKASALVGMAKTAVWFKVPDAAQRSQTLYHQVLRRYPATSAAATAREGIIEFMEDDRKNIDAVLAQIQSWEKQITAEETVKLLTKVASGLSSPTVNVETWKVVDEAQPERALTIYEDVIRRYPDLAATRETMMKAAEMYQRSGDENRTLNLWLRVAQSTATPERIFLDGDTRGQAIGKLGAYYMTKQQWAEALRWWQQFRSTSFCGNGQDSENGRNQYRIAKCLLQLQREPEALKVMEAWTFHDSLEETAEMAVALAETYRNQGRLKELENRVRTDLKKHAYHRQAAATLNYIELLNARERKDIAALWQPIEKKSFNTLNYLTWWQKYSGKFLTELPKEVAPFLLAKAPLRAAKVSPARAGQRKTAEARADESAWACLLLAKMKSPALLPIIQANLRAVSDENYLKNQLAALALLGTPDGYAIIEQMAQSGKGKTQKMALAVLKAFPANQPIAFLDSEKSLLGQGAGFENSEYWALGADL